MTTYENILLFPFLIMEVSGEYSTISIDFGQLLLFIIIVLWRKELVRLINRILRGKHG